MSERRSNEGTILRPGPSSTVHGCVLLSQPCPPSSGFIMEHSFACSPAAAPGDNSVVLSIHTHTPTREPQHVQRNQTHLGSVHREAGQKPNTLHSSQRFHARLYIQHAAFTPWLRLQQHNTQLPLSLNITAQDLITHTNKYTLATV